jgi:hypothetical protein
MQNITISRVRIIFKKKCTLTWKGGPLLMVAKPHPPWSLAWSWLSLYTQHLLSHQQNIYLHSDDINMPLLLSGTVLFKIFIQTAEGNFCFFLHVLLILILCCGFHTAFDILMEDVILVYLFLHCEIFVLMLRLLVSVKVNIEDVW